MEHIVNKFFGFFAALALFYFLIPNVANATNPKNLAASIAEISLSDYLAKEKQHITQTLDAKKQSSEPKSLADYQHRTQRNAHYLTLINAKLDNLQSFLDNQKKLEQDLEQRIKQLQQLPILDSNNETLSKVDAIELQIDDSQKAQDLISDNVSLTNQLKAQILEETTALDLWHENYILNQKLNDVSAKVNHLKSDLSSLYQKNIQANKPVRTIQNYSELDSVLLLNNQSIALDLHELSILNTVKSMLEADKLALKSFTIKTGQSVVDIYKESLAQMNKIEHALTQLNKVIVSEAALAVNRKYQASFSSLQAKVAGLQNLVAMNKDNALKELNIYQDKLKKLISTRQSLSDYNIYSWPNIIAKMSGIPKQLFNYFQTLFLKVYDSYNWLSIFNKILLLSSCLGLVAMFAFLRKALKKRNVSVSRQSLTGNVLDVFIQLIINLIPTLCFTTILVVVFYLTGFQFASYQLLFDLILLRMAYKSVVMIARLTLFERLSDMSGKDVKLYYRIQWLSLVGSVITALMMMSYLLPLANTLQDIFGRLFMLFILTLSIFAWKSRDVIYDLSHPLFNDKRMYFKNAFFMLMFLIPLTLFLSALIGLAGFINLAWTMGGYLFYALLIAISYVLTRGLVLDGLDTLSELMVSRMQDGWLWTEVVLKPLDKVLRVVLIVLFVLLAFKTLGWDGQSPVVQFLISVARYSIINLPGASITVASVLEFFIILSFFIWAIKWTREFSYRWLYNNAKDLAIRNSLAVFTQYAVVLLGCVLCLHVLGVDLSGLSMILGGLAVGMGFGLRDFANNIIGGMMLLIERPVREGDMVTLGTHEGEVTHIGIRAMRLSTGDNMEVLIPNAETLNKPFTNWTLQDSIIRTVVPIKVCRSDDPAYVQKVILDVLKATPEVVLHPEPQVLLKKIDEALIEFEARYFMNVHTHSRVELRSKVLFEITKQFKEHSIRPPIEPVAIEIKEGLDAAFKKKHPSNV